VASQGIEKFFLTSQMETGNDTDFLLAPKEKELAKKCKCHQLGV
jgi:hypothetical protein